MNVLESIVKDLETLPPRQLVEVACYVHGLSKTAQARKHSLLQQTHGILSEEDGLAFEEALNRARHLES